MRNCNKNSILLSVSFQSVVRFYEYSLDMYQKLNLLHFKFLFDDSFVSFKRIVNFLLLLLILAVLTFNFTHYV